MITLSALDLAIAAVLVMLLALLSVRVHPDLGKRLVIAACRTTVQLLLVGMVLKTVFAHAHLYWVLIIAFIMVLVAGYEVSARQTRRFTGWWRIGIGTSSMSLSSFAVTLFALGVIIGNQPWYAPQYAIPLLGMLLGNTMSGIAIALDRLTLSAWDQRGRIEARLILGQSSSQAIRELRHDCIRSGLIPIINAMSAAGIVSLPGMMTGQILAGAAPVEAVKYQILIMFLIATGTGLGTMIAVWAGSRRLFDERQRLRLDRLGPASR